MSWFYSGNPNTSAKDFVRFLLGDVTNPATPNSTVLVFLSDEEIAYSLSEVNNEAYRAASNCAYILSARYMGFPDAERKSVGGLSISKTYSDRSARYEKLAQDLLRRSRMVNPPMVNADPKALGAEFHIGEMDPYYAEDNVWPTDSALGVSSEYGTGYGADYDEGDGG